MIDARVAFHERLVRRSGDQPHLLALQMPLVQSEPTMQLEPVAHLGQVPPPQSTSVSRPFLMPSVQVAGWQTAPKQLNEVQSASLAQEISQALPAALQV